MILIILLTALLAVSIAYQCMRRSKLPPGPFPFLLLGNIPQLGWSMMKTGGLTTTLREMKKEYGNVFTIWLGPLPTVHITDLALAQETMVKQGTKFQYRWVPDLMEEGRGEHLHEVDGRIRSFGVERRGGSGAPEVRLHAFRNFGMSRNIMEDRIMMEINLRFADIDARISEGDNLINPFDFFDLLVGSIINRMLFSERFDKEHEKEFFRVKHFLDEMIENLSAIDMFAKRSFAKLPIIGARYRKITEPFLTLKEFLAQQVTQRLADIENGIHVIEGEGTDYTDAFIKKMREEEEDQHQSIFSEETLVINLMDLWIAGQETTTTTLLWAMVLLLNHEKDVSKIREEVSRVTENKRSLSLQDKLQTPYLVATITEIQRMASILNLNLWRQSPEDTVVGGFPVAKGTPIAAQLAVIMADEKHIKQPEKFLPSRFLSGDRLDQHVIPFGIGKRACLGESLARAELYLIIGNLIQRFEIRPEDRAPSMLSTTPKMMMNRPTRFMMRMHKIQM